MAKRGFTLVEVLITTMLVGVTITALMGGLRTITATESKARTTDLLQRLAKEELDELGTVTDPGTVSKGDFTDNGYPDITWTVDVESPGLTNLDKVTVTATRGKDSQSLSELIYVPPVTGSTSSP